MQTILCVKLNCCFILVKNKIYEWSTCPNFNSASFAEIHTSIQCSGLIFFAARSFYQPFNQCQPTRLKFSICRPLPFFPFLGPWH